MKNTTSQVAEQAGRQGSTRPERRWAGKKKRDERIFLPALFVGDRCCCPKEKAPAVRREGGTQEEPDANPPVVSREKEAFMHA